MPKWWDDGKAYYAPDDPFLNLNMIWIAGFAPFVLFGAVMLILGLLHLLGLV